MKGLVYKSTGSWYKVRNSSGNFIVCRLKGKLRIKGLKVTNPVSVGDIVEVEMEKEKKQGLFQKLTVEKII